MKIGNVFSAYLKADDLGTKTPIVAIREVKLELLGQEDKKEEKAVVYFEGHHKGLALNRTNADSIVEIAGTDETDEWIGVQVQLYVDPKVKFGTKTMPAIRIRAPRAVTPPTPARGVAKAPVETHPDYGTEEDDTPF